MSFKDKMGLYFVDHDMVPLLVQENYISAAGSGNSAQDIMKLALQADYISLGDCISF